MINKKELESVQKLDANKRFKYTIKRLSDFEDLWVLGDINGFVTYTDNIGNILFPIWPFKDYAELCINGDFIHSSPEKIQVKEFIEEYLPSFKSNGYKLVIFPTSTDRGVLIEIDYFIEQMENENSKY
jgi:hypothetical protein